MDGSAGVVFVRDVGIVGGEEPLGVADGILLARKELAVESRVVLSVLSTHLLGQLLRVLRPAEGRVVVVEVEEIPTLTIRAPL